MAWQNLSEYRLKAAMHEEAHEGWLWIDGTGWRSGDPIVLRYKNGKTRRVHLICRTIDYNFRGYYNAEMKSRYKGKVQLMHDATAYLFVAKHYRDRLRIEAGITTAAGIMVKGLEAKQPSGPAKIWSRFRAATMHSDPYVRIGTWLAVIGLVVAFFALIPIFVEFPKWAPWGN